MDKNESELRRAVDKAWIENIEPHPALKLSVLYSFSLRELSEAILNRDLAEGEGTIFAAPQSFREEILNLSGIRESMAENGPVSSLRYMQLLSRIAAHTVINLTPLRFQAVGDVLKDKPKLAPTTIERPHIKDLDTRRKRARFVSQYVSNVPKRFGALGYTPQELQNANRFNEALAALLFYVGYADPTDTFDRNTSPLYKEVRHNATGQMLNHFIQLRARSFPTEETLQIFEDVFIEEHLGHFLNQVGLERVAALTCGIYAELRAAFDLMDRRHAVGLTSEEFDRLGVDLMATSSPKDKTYVQVKGSVYLKDLSYFDISKQEQREALSRSIENLPSGTRANLKKGMKNFIEVAREDGATPLWYLVPTGDLKSRCV